jgi:hypothetical protein
LGPLHPKYAEAVEEMKRVTDEIEKRQTLASVAAAAVTAPQLNLSADTLRDEARRAYDHGWATAKEQGKDDDKAHETALVSVLLNRLRQDMPDLQITQAMIETLMLEMIPFNVVAPENGKRAIIEYVAWREHPMSADERLIASTVGDAITSIRARSDESFINNMRNTPYPWAKLIPQAIG